MKFRQTSYKNPALWAWIIFLIAACVSKATPAPSTPQAIVSTVPTLTPFQVQNNSSANPYSQPITSPIELTFTPYPTHYAPLEGLPTPAEILPPLSVDASNPNPLDINNPLTGLPVSDPALLERRPMAIKVANAPDYVRPQSGLTLADVVFEYYIEWGDTRFIAVMYGNDSPMVGPVRSGRYFDEHVADMYNAFLAFKGADPRELSYLRNSTLNDFLVIVYTRNTVCPPVALGPAKRESYNNAFFNTEKWAICAAKRGVDNSRQPLRNGFFSEEVPESALNVKRMFFHYSIYSYNYWEYDIVTHKYFRYQEANDMVKGKTEAYAPLIDAQTGQQVSADNVVVLFVPYTFANHFNAADEVYNIDLLDSGNAYVFRNGVAVPAQWHRTDKDQPLLLTTLMGAPIYLHPGRTFYEVLGINSPYTQIGTDWRFTFKTP
jgi:hypothetical protein